MIDNINLKTHVDISAIKGGRGNPILFELPTSVTYTLDDAKINEDIFSALCQSMAQVGTSAKEMGEALRKLSICLYDKDKQEFKSTKDILEELADEWNEIGCINPATPDEISQALAGPATPEATETPNQNADFDFLEQNAYDSAKNIFDGEQFGQIIPLDIPKNL